MTIQEQQRQNEVVQGQNEAVHVQKRNEVVLRIRKLQNKEKERGGLDSFDWAELIELINLADKNGWIY